MPLDESDWKQLGPSKSQIAIMRDFLEDNAPQAYTLEEIADETEVVMASSSGGQIPMSSPGAGSRPGNRASLSRTVGRAVVEDANVERRADSSGVEYYRYNVE